MSSNWIRLTDTNTGRQYWGNRVTKQTQWHTPDELLPAAVPPPPPRHIPRVTSPSSPPPPPPPTPVLGGSHRGGASVLPSTHIHVRHQTSGGNTSAAATLAASIVSGIDAVQLRSSGPAEQSQAAATVRSELQLKYEEMRRTVTQMKMELTNANEELCIRRQTSKSITASDKSELPQIQRQLSETVDELANEKSKSNELQRQLDEAREQLRQAQLSIRQKETHMSELEVRVKNQSRDIARLTKQLNQDRMRNESIGNAGNELEAAMKRRRDKQLRQQQAAAAAGGGVGGDVTAAEVTVQRDTAAAATAPSLNPLQRLRQLQATGDKGKLKDVLQERLTASTDEFVLPAVTPHVTKGKKRQHKRATSEFTSDVTRALLQAPPIQMPQLGEVEEEEEVDVTGDVLSPPPVVKKTHTRAHTTMVNVSPQHSVDDDKDGKDDGGDDGDTAAAAAGGGDWTTHVDGATGRTYYYNTVTKVTTWVSPYTDVDTVNDTNSAASDEWTSHEDERTGLTYYYNHKTNVTQWDPPNK